MPIIFFDSPGNASDGTASAAPAPAVSFTNSRRFNSGFNTDESFRMASNRQRALPPMLYRLSEIFPQSQAAILVQFLMARPAHGIPHPLHFNLSAELQPF